MEPRVVYVIATVAWILVSGALGLLLRRRRPYGRVLRLVHPVLIVFVIAGWLSLLFHELPGPLPAGFMVLMIVFALTIVINLLTGLRMLMGRLRAGLEPRIHVVSTVIMLVLLLGIAFNL